MTLVNFIKALIGGILWASLCYIIVKLFDINGGDEE